MASMTIWCEQCGEREATSNPMGEALFCQECLELTLRIATPREFSPTTLKLAASLACYCSDEDMGLDRKSFLECVRDRIEDDLSNLTY